jgi:hypothetical protein
VVGKQRNSAIQTDLAEGTAGRERHDSERGEILIQADAVESEIAPEHPSVPIEGINGDHLMNGGVAAVAVAVTPDLSLVNLSSPTDLSSTINKRQNDRL